MALIAFLSIGLAFLATEPERLDVEGRRSAVVDLTELTTQLSNAVRDQEAAINQHLLARDDESVARYRDGIEQELRLSERMRLRIGGLSGIDVTLSTLSTELVAWRLQFAEPAIAAVAEQNELAIDRLGRQRSPAEGPDAGRIEEISAQLHDAYHDLSVREDVVTATRDIAAALGAF